MGRGLERRRIFNSDDDKQSFLDRLGSILERLDTECLAWCVMSNHYHLLIRVGQQPLSRLMSPLLGGYAGDYNRRHSRSGYVFQNRYRSILCDADRYLLELVRYIHLNPLRAGMLPTMAALDRYPWSGHAVVLGKHKIEWQSVDPVLRHFAKRADIARSRYRAFVQDGWKKRDQPNLSGGGLVRSYGSWENLKRLRKEHSHCIGDERILGDSDFVEQALAQDKLAMEKRTSRQQAGWDLDALVECVCHYCEVDKNHLTRKSRNNSLSLAKGLISYWGTEELGLTMREIARCLSISQPAVSNWVRQGKAYCDEEALTLDAIDY
jgi:REP element-mobilizing transposase RayT